MRKRVLLVPVVLLAVLPLAGCIHWVSAPEKPVGNSSGEVGQTLVFATTGATCSKNHPVEYRFGWGDGTFSDWKTGSVGSQSWPTAGTYQVKAQARCAVDSSRVSAWSSPLSVTIGVPGGGEYLFYDDFEEGAHPDWSLTTSWRWRDGILYACGHNSRQYGYVSPGKDWTNYVVEAEVVMAHPDHVGFLVRCSEDLQSYVMIYGRMDRLRWSVVIAGETTDSGSLEPGWFEGRQSVRIVAAANQIDVYINNLRRLSLSAGGLLKGMPGITGVSSYGSCRKAGFDTFKVTATP